MSQKKSSRRPATTRRPNATIAAQSRAKRARDHLARKRTQEMNRLERQRGRAASSSTRAQTRGRLTPILIFVAFAAGILLAPLFSRNLLYRGSPLERVAVQGATALTAADVTTTLNLPAGRLLDSIATQEIRDAVEAEPWIESIRSLRLPGGTLIVAIVEREAVARWLKRDSGEIEMIDERGVRFSGRSEPGGPLPLVVGSLDEGRGLSASAILILDELKKHAILAEDPTALTLRLPANANAMAETTTGTVDDELSGYVLHVGETGPRALLGKRFLRQRIARLAALLESDESRIQDARLIDLRYADRAVLRSEPASG